MNFNFIDLYPTRIWSLQADHLAVHHEAWLHAIEAMRLQNPDPQGRSSRAAWNSHEKLFDDEVFAPLKATLLESVASILKNQFNIADNRRASVVAWANVHEQGGFNTQHLHPHNTFSGAYYLSVPDGAGPIVFRDPRYAALMNPIGPADESAILPKAGQLLIFPSWLEHRVEINQANAQRVSIAFNVGLR
jgi:uncharacterized protein (TIGR02466 family)